MKRNSVEVLLEVEVDVLNTFLLELYFIIFYKFLLLSWRMRDCMYLMLIYKFRQQLILPIVLDGIFDDRVKGSTLCFPVSSIHCHL